MAARVLQVLTVCACVALFIAPASARDAWEPFQPGETERIVQKLEDLPEQWVTEIKETIPNHILSSAFSTNNVKLRPFRENRKLLTIAREGVVTTTEVFFGGTHTPKHAIFAVLDQEGGFKATSRLWYVDWNAETEMLTSKVCNDVGSMGCGRDIYRYNGVGFTLVSVETQESPGKPWKSFWTAQKIEIK